MGLVDQYAQLAKRVRQAEVLLKYDRFTQKIYMSWQFLEVLMKTRPLFRHNLKRIQVFGSSVFCGMLIMMFGKQGTMYDKIGKFPILDVSGEYLMQTANQKGRLNIAKWKILEEVQNMDKIDDLTLTQLGMLCAEGGKPEFSFHCYEILHLRNHSKFRTNSDLLIETNVKMQTAEKDIEKVSVNEILETVS